MKKLVTLILFSIVAVISSRADLIWYEGFQYPNGSLACPANTANPLTLNLITNCSSGGYWVRDSGNGIPAIPASDMWVVNSNLQVTATGGTLVNRSDDCMRYFATTNGTPPASLFATYGVTNYDTPMLLYASFTVICTTSLPTNGTVSTNLPGFGLPNGPGSYFASFYNNTNYGNSPGSIATTNSYGYGYCGRVQAFTNGTIVPNTWRMGVTDNTLATNHADGGFPVDLGVNTPYQVVEEIDPQNLGVCTIWVNPIKINQSGAAPVDPYYQADDSMGKMLLYGVNGYAFRQPSSFGAAAFIITNLAVATTFAEAMTNVQSTNAVAPVVVYQPVGVTNFAGSSFKISVVANGQGLANLTYQWQENSNNYSNPNGNSNVLPFNSVSSSFGTNYFDVIVTTPYGLSVTSSVVGVAVDNTPQAPVFLTQPVNTALYRGQNAIISTTVASPGNVTFTWYSNNVVVSGGVTSGSYSSQLEIDNLTPNNAATFRVAATNDVFATGIVSTNATLTVKVPAAVSIAFLHQLVDKTTWQATNTPPSIAYSASGLITTYTNLTTGNTASYYLQDGTGGINIFVTGASTFRPQLGDMITFVGVMSSFTSGLELYADVNPGTPFPYTSFTNTGNNIAGLPAPRPISFNIITNVAFMNTNLGGLYVQIADVNFGARGGTTTSTGGNDFLAVSNSLNQKFTLMFPDLDLDVAGRTLPSYAYNVSGVLYSTNGVATNIMVVTRWSDVVTTPPGISIICPGNITVTSSVPTNITFNLTNFSGGCSTPVVTSVPASGSAFSVGTTTVNVTASDACQETNTCSFTVTVVSPGLIPSVSPSITSFALSGANVVIGGTNGQTTGIYYLLTSTNMGSPLSLWQVVATNIIATNGANGAFTFTGTNVVIPGKTNQFYILSNTNSNH
jgi:hypothetical protein